jgi:hypothetical protein
MKQVILASLLALVVVLVFALFLTLVYRNPGKAKALLLSFATFEGMLTLEVRYGVRCRSHEPSSGGLIPVVVGSAAMRRSLGYRRYSQRPGFIFLPAYLPATAPLLQPPTARNADVCIVAGDGFFIAQIVQNRAKGWVKDLWIPYIVMFSLASAASAASVGLKLFLFAGKLKSRRASAMHLRRVTLGGVPVAPQLAHTVSYRDLKEKFDIHKLDKTRYFCCTIADSHLNRAGLPAPRLRPAWLMPVDTSLGADLLVAVCEDLPMGGCATRPTALCPEYRIHIIYDTIRIHHAFLSQTR